MNDKKIDAEIKILAGRKGRHMYVPFCGQLSDDKYMLLYHDAPERDPQTRLDPKSFLAVATGPDPFEIDTSAAFEMPRFTCSGYAPSVTRLEGDRFVVLDNAMHIYHWLGEPMEHVVPDHDWVIMLRGAHSIIVDNSGDRPKFGKPRRICDISYPLLETYAPPIPHGPDSFMCACDFNTNCTKMEKKPWEVIIMQTADAGESWTKKSSIYFEKDMPELPRLGGPVLLETGQDAITCFLSACETDGEFFISTSTDGGESWTGPESAGVKLIEPYVIPLNDGRLLLAGKPVDKRTAICCWLSEDSGNTWPENSMSIIEDGAIDNMCGAPRGFCMPDGSVFLTYHLQKDKTGPQIHGARFRV